MGKYQEALLEQSGNLVTVDFSEGRVTRESPSNIAIVKYWGKKENQLPKNPSISFSLNKSKTNTVIEYSISDKKQTKPKINFVFEGKENAPFQLRIEKFINSVLPYFPFFQYFNLKIQSENTFPHSAGIASSASGLSSIALCLCDIERNLFGTLEKEEDFYKKASFIARLGSGSASRSVYPRWSMWGKHSSYENSSDEYAIPLTGIHRDFERINDAVLLVSTGKKSISSSAGHELMNNHCFAASRMEQANTNCENLIPILKAGDLEGFIEIAENEALTLHALMMSSNPGYLLLQPNSIRIIEKIKQFRNETKLPVGFTVDAGPNIHLLYFSKDKKQVAGFIKAELLKFCENGKWIDDGIGEERLK